MTSPKVPPPAVGRPASKSEPAATESGASKADEKLDRELDQELDDSFPASDPLPWSHEVK